MSVWFSSMLDAPSGMEWGNVLLIFVKGLQISVIFHLLILLNILNSFYLKTCLTGLIMGWRASSALSASSAVSQRSGMRFMGDVQRLCQNALRCPNGSNLTWKPSTEINVLRKLSLPRSKFFIGRYSSHTIVTMLFIRAQYQRLCRNTKRTCFSK